MKHILALFIILFLTALWYAIRRSRNAQALNPLSPGLGNAPVNRQFRPINHLSELPMPDTRTTTTQTDTVAAELTALTAKIQAIPTTEASAAALIEAKDKQIADLTAQVASLQSQLALAVSQDTADIATIEQISADLDAVIATAVETQVVNAEAAPALAAAVASAPTEVTGIPETTATATAAEATGTTDNATT